MSRDAHLSNDEAVAKTGHPGIDVGWKNEQRQRLKTGVSPLRRANSVEMKRIVVVLRESVPSEAEVVGACGGMKVQPFKTRAGS